MKRYTYKHTKDLTRRIGLSDNGLRLYEKAGIIHPTYNEQNGYRELKLRDAQLLSTGLTFSRCCFSIRETAEMINKKNIMEQAELMEQRSREKTDELIYQLRAAQCMAERAAQLQRYTAAPYFCRQLTIRPLYILPVHDQDMAALPGEPDSAWWATNCKPFSIGAYIIDEKRFRTGDGGMIIGASLWEEEVRYTGAPVNRAIKVGEETVHYVQAFSCYDLNDPLPKSSYEHVLQYLDNHGLMICSDVFTRALTCERQGGSWHCLCEIYVPIKGKDA